VTLPVKGEKRTLNSYYLRSIIYAFSES